MKKILFILLLLPVFIQAQSIDYWAERKKQKQQNFNTKTPGSQLKAAGTAFYLSMGFVAIGTLTSTQIVDDKGEINDFAKTVTYAAGGCSLISTLIAYGKLISAGNLLDEEKRKNEKKTSFNFTGNGLSLVYKF